MRKGDKMFIYAFGDFKEQWKKYLLIFLAVICTLAVIVITLYIHGGKMPDTATCDQIGEYSLITENVSDDITFLGQFGLCADKDTVVTDNVKIPSEFNSHYEKYNDLQQKIGLDLENYKGVTAKRSTYKLENYENNSKVYYATLLIYENRVIGGHISSNIYGEEYRSFR